MRLALVGNGRMTRAIARLAMERGHAVTAVITGAENRSGEALTAERLAGVEVVFEFTRPDAAPGNLVRLAALGVPVVCGTTGWEPEAARVRQAFEAAGGALLTSPNFSVGVQLFLRAGGDLARRFAGRAEFDAFVTETHHAAKRDAPSGTASRLAERLRAEDPGRAFPVTSIRGGYAPGTHTLIYDSPGETIRLEHAARSRDAFAAGAIAAGEWLRGRNGVFTFEQMLFEEAP